MADMRLNDWITIGVTALRLLGFGVSVMFLIVLWPHIVSIVSGLSTRMRAEGEARRAYRQRVYDYDHMSSNKVSRTLFPIEEFSAVSADETNSETAEIPQRVGEIHAESFTLGETAALARLVAQNKLGLTDAVKIGADAKSGEKYQKRSREIKAAVQNITDKYPQRTPEQEKLRQELGIAKP